MTISSHAAKAKARGLQQWVMHQISDLTGIPCGKDEMIASREMGQSGTDVRLIGEAKRMFPFSVECKRQENWSIPAWIKQAKSNQEPGTEWLLFCRRNNEEAVVVMDAEAFFHLLRMYKRNTEVTLQHFGITPEKEEIIYTRGRAK